MIVELVSALAAGAPPPVVPSVTRAQTGDVVGFTLRTNRRTRVYLAPAGARIRGAADTRLRYLGTSAGARTASFPVPAVDTGSYRVWCTPCARAGALLHVSLPSFCPVTPPLSGIPTRREVGNDALRGWSDTLRATAAGDGSFTWKLYWQATTQYAAAFFLSASRLDVRGPRASIGRIHRGTTTTTPSWASVLTFPSAGCWRITAVHGEFSMIRVVEIP